MLIRHGETALSARATSGPELRAFLQDMETRARASLHAAESGAHGRLKAWSVSWCARCHVDLQKRVEPVKDTLECFVKSC